MVVRSAASPGCSKGADVGLSSVDVGGDDVREGSRPQNCAPHVKNGRYAELGSIDALGQVVGTHVGFWVGSQQGGQSSRRHCCGFVRHISGSIIYAQIDVIVAAVV